MAEPLPITVIIPTFNRAQLVATAVESVLAQTIQPQRIFVVDDGSSDDTASVIQHIKQSQPSVDFVALEHTGYPAAVRNAGLEHADTPWVAFLDSDDRWQPTKLEQQWQTITRQPELDLVCSNASVVTAGEEPTGRCVVADRSTGELPLSELLLDNVVITSSVLARKSLIDKVDCFCVSDKLRTCQDYDLWLRLAASGWLYFEDAPLVVYRDQPTSSIRGSVTNLQHHMTILAILERIQPLLRDAAERKSLNHRRRREVKTAAKACFQQGKWTAGLSLASRWLLDLPIVEDVPRATGVQVEDRS